MGITALAKISGLNKKLKKIMHFFEILLDRFNNLYTRGDRSSLVFKNIVNSIFFKGLGIVLSLILVPMSISYVGAEEYGVWLTVSSVASWMIQFDFGLGNGLRNKLTKDNSLQDFENARVYVSSIYAVMALIAVGFLVIFLIFDQFVDWQTVFNTPDNLSSPIKTVVYLVMILVCISFVVQLLHTILTAVHLNYKANLVNTFCLLFSLIVLSAFYYFSESNLVLLVVALGFASLLATLFFSVYYFFNDLKKYRPSFNKIDFKTSKSLISVGGMFFIIQIGTLVLYQTSNIIIANVLGHEDVAVYNVVYKYFTALFMVVSVILNPYWTGFAEAFGLNDYTWIKNSMKKLRKIFFLFIILNVFSLFVSPFVFEIWIGERLNIPFEVTFFISLYFLVFFWFNIHMTLINGVGKLRVLVIVILIAAFVNVPLSIYLGKLWGLIGVVSANSIVLFVLGIVTYIQSQKIINQKAEGIWFK
jgi:O-antigen/teichoic acid export membrane protein